MADLLAAYQRPQKKQTNPRPVQPEKENLGMGFVKQARAEDVQNSRARTSRHA